MHDRPRAAAQVTLLGARFPSLAIGQCSVVDGSSRCGAAGLQLWQMITSIDLGFVEQVEFLH